MELEYRLPSRSHSQLSEVFARLRSTYTDVRCPNLNDAHFQSRLRFLKDFCDLMVISPESEVLNIGVSAGSSSRALALTGAKVTTLELGSLAPSSLEFSSKHFNLIFCSGLLERSSSPVNVLRELTRILKTNGMIVMEQDFAWSLRNLKSDPEYRLPFVSALPKSLRQGCARLMNRQVSGGDRIKYPFAHAQLRAWLRYCPNLKVQKWYTPSYGRLTWWKVRTTASVIFLKKFG